MFSDENRAVGMAVINHFLWSRELLLVAVGGHGDVRVSHIGAEATACCAIPPVPPLEAAAAGTAVLAVLAAGLHAAATIRTPANPRIETNRFFIRMLLFFWSRSKHVWMLGYCMEAGTKRKHQSLLE